MVIILDCHTDVYSSPDRTGKQKLIKKNVQFKKSFESNNITIQHFIDSKGNLSKKYSMVFEGPEGFKVNKKFEELERLVSPVKIEGFKIRGKK